MYVVKEYQSLKDLDQYLPNDIEIESFIILGFDKTVEIQAKHFCHYADMPSKLEISLNLNNVFVGRRMVSCYLEYPHFELKLFIELFALLKNFEGIWFLSFVIEDL